MRKITNLKKRDVEIEWNCEDLIVNGSHYNDPGCMYHNNGDPGDPPETETEIHSVIWKKKKYNKKKKLKEFDTYVDVSDLLLDYQKIHEEIEEKFLEGLE